MAWLTLSLKASADYAEALSDALLEHGALSVDMLDADADTPDEQAIFGEPGEPTRQSGNTISSTPCSKAAPMSPASCKPAAPNSA